MLYITIPSAQQIDYFSSRPQANHDHFSIETPLASPGPLSEDTTAIPSNSLLARRVSFDEYYTPITPVPAPSFLQMQTAASRGSPIRRPDPSPVQNVLHTTSDDSEKSADSSSSSGLRTSSIEIARCSRCHRTPSIDAKTGKNNMVQYGLNLWYCARCAQMVGLVNR